MAPANNSMQRTALRAAADAERYGACRWLRVAMDSPGGPKVMKVLLVVTGFIETGAGLALMAFPAWTVGLFLGPALEASSPMAVVRTFGALLLALGIGCWDLPVVMFGISFRLGKNFVLVAEEAILPRISYDNYGGSALNLGLAFEYEFLNHYGVGVAYDDFRIRFEAEGERAVGEFEYDISGPQAYVKFFW